VTHDEMNRRLGELLKKADTNIDDMLVGYEKELRNSYREALGNIKRQIADMYERYGNDVNYSDMVSYNRLTNLENNIQVELAKLYKKGTKTISKSITSIYEESYNLTGSAIQKTLGVKSGFGLLNPQAVKASVLNPLDRIQWGERAADHIQQLNNTIRQEITQGLIQGKGYAKVAKAITERTEIAGGRALTIVRTETHRVQNAARDLAFEKANGSAKRLGLEIRKKWLHKSRKGEREEHKRMNGVLANKDGIFKLPSGIETPGPGLSGVAAEDINCTCTVASEIIGL